MQSLHINTNGFFTEKIIFLVRTLAPILDKKGIKLSFLVSLDGIGEKHNNIRRNPQSFYAVEKTISALKLLREKYIFEFFVNCTLFRKNLHEISNIEKWCESQKISFRFNMINFFDIGFVKNIDKKRELDFREEDKKYLFKVLEELSSNNHLVSAVRNYSLEVLRLYKDNAHRITICPFVKNGFRIDPCGNIYYCFKQNMIGNFLKDRSVSKIFYLPKNLINRQKIAEETCRYCNAFCRTL
jgi:MoaA/NifB/PqqE/SkfB family radical SAM enzyme